MEIIMDEIAIQVSNISKKFKIYKTPKDRFKESISIRKKCYHKEFTALENVSFSLKKGSTMGILGINGSGKSTLLKIICGYLQSTSGGVRVRGRISAILELGTGFNREFTGRENVVLYGGLMGLSRAYIMEKMPEVENFADIGDFFDQPMRLYSSGMYARLAFACAINTDPDILVIDEALAVGDAAFQHKCIHKIKQIQKKGVTILFVSHSIGAIKSLCQEGILLENGRVVKIGNAEDVANDYHARLALKEQEKATAKKKDAVDSTFDKAGTITPSMPNTTSAGNGDIRIEGVFLLDKTGNSLKSVDFNQEVCVSVKLKAVTRCHPAVVGIFIRDYYGIDLLGTNTRVEGVDLPVLEAGQCRSVEFSLRLPLLKGSYSITAAVRYDQDQPVFYDWKDNACIFEMLPPMERRIVNCKLYLPIKVEIK